MVSFSLQQAANISFLQSLSTSAIAIRPNEFNSMLIFSLFSDTLTNSFRIRNDYKIALSIHCADTPVPAAWCICMEGFRKVFQPQYAASSLGAQMSL